MAKCVKCGKEKSPEEFYSRNGRPFRRCKACICVYAKRRYLTEGDKILEYNRKWQMENKERMKEVHKVWVANNRVKVRMLNNKASRKYRSSQKGRLKKVISCAVWRSLKGSKNRHGWEKLVGYTSDQLRDHLENNFKSGMTWDNYGLWHIDHKIPVSAFNFSVPEDIDFKRCWSLGNLQPLWAIENWKKNSRMESVFQPSLNINCK